jgi:hypothetical protein
VLFRPWSSPGCLLGIELSEIVVVDLECAFLNFFFFFLSFDFSESSTTLEAPTGALGIASLCSSVSCPSLCLFSFFFFFLSVSCTDEDGGIWFETLAITLPRSATMFCRKQILELRLNI